MKFPIPWTVRSLVGICDSSDYAALDTSYCVAYQLYVCITGRHPHKRHTSIKWQIGNDHGKRHFTDQLQRT